MPQRSDLHALYEKYSGGVAYLDIENADGSHSIGTAFHVRDGVFISARHVVENGVIREVATTVPCGGNGLIWAHQPSKGAVVEGPYFHPNPATDLAVMKVAGISAPDIPIGQIHPAELPILTKVLVLGYPPIPLSNSPVLVAATGEVSAVVDNYLDGGTHLILSTMARGGFSGGVAITGGDYYDNEGTLGLITRSFLRDGQPVELGYLAVLPLETIYSCHGLFESELDWYLSPGRKAAGERLVRSGREGSPSPKER